MLTVDVSINGTLIARIKAVNVENIEDGPGDFAPKQVRRYNGTVTTYRPLCGNWHDEVKQFSVVHDRREGWQGLVNKITAQCIPVIIETVSAEEVDAG